MLQSKAFTANMIRVLSSIMPRALPGHCLTPKMNGQKACWDLLPPSGLLKSGLSGLNLSGKNSFGLCHYSGHTWEAKGLTVTTSPLGIVTPSFRITCFLVLYPRDLPAGGENLNTSFANNERYSHSSKFSPVTLIFMSFRVNFPFSNMTLSTSSQTLVNSSGHFFS